MPSERFSSQEFWDCFDLIGEEELEQAQIRLLGVWKHKQLVSRRLLAYDTTNFYTYVASTDTRNELAQRGHNKQGRHNQMNLQLHHVISDIVGQTGLAIVGAILEGERDPHVLARLRNQRIKASEEVIAKSLIGDYRAEHLFTLRQSLDACRSYGKMIEECDREMGRCLEEFRRPEPPTASAGAAQFRCESRVSWSDRCRRHDGVPSPEHCRRTDISMRD